MFGVEMLLKNLGLDPEAIKKSVEEFGHVIIAMKDQMDRIEKKLDVLTSDKLSASDLVADDNTLIAAGIIPLETKED